MTNTYNNRLRTGLSLAQPTGSWTNGFGYDAAKRLTSVTSPAGTFSYQYSSTQPSLLVQKLSLPNTSYITNTYDSVARLLFTKLNNSSHTILDSALYGYNAGNQRTTFTNTAGTYVSYTYDKIGQLKVADSSVNTEDRGYFYDAAWNLNYRTNNTTLNAFYYVDGKNQLTNSSITALNQFDSNGNLTNSDGSVVYQYDDENRLTRGEDVDKHKWATDFIYDGLGRLRSRLEYTWSGSAWVSAGRTNYVYDGMRVIQERNLSNVPAVSYTRGTDLSGTLEGAGGIGGLLARSHGYSAGNWSTHNYYHADGNGNVTYLVDSSQSLAASYRYDPYGNTISSSGTLASANVYRFSSKEFHANSGFYYYGYRWYAPNLQRWPNRDPIGELGGINLYGYVGNNPINYVDPLGLINWMTEWWADLSVNGSWWQRPIANVLGPISAVVPDSIGWSASDTVGFGPGVTGGYNDQGFISKPCPEAARYNLTGVIAGTPQASVDAQVSLGWSFNSSDKSGPDSWKGWFTGFQLGVGPYVVSASLGDGWFNFTYGVGGGASITPGITFNSFATYYDLQQKY